MEALKTRYGKSPIDPEIAHIDDSIIDRYFIFYNTEWTHSSTGYALSDKFLSEYYKKGFA